jgi:hypothetical protein
VDTPTNNFCTVNPLTFPRQGDTTALWGRATEGNLRWTSAGGSWGGHCFFGGTFSIAPNTGKYYWEMLDIGNKSVGSFANYGWGTGLIVVNDGPNGSGYIGRNTSVGSNTGYSYKKSGNGVGSRCQYNGSSSSENIAVPCSTSGPYVFKFCYDSDNGKFYMGGDAGWATHDSAGTPETSAAPTATNYLFNNITYDVTPLFYAFQMTTMTDNMHNFGQDASFAGNVTGTPAYATDDNGVGDFYYAPPTGYLALCTSNLPSPEIALPGENFNTVLWTGNNVDGRVFSDVLDFQLDFSWIKNRTTGYHNILMDSVRGFASDKKLASNLTAVEGDSTELVGTTGYVSAVSSTGFTLSGSNPLQTNKTSEGNYVGWNWKAGTTNSGATSGSGTLKTYSSSTDATSGFSVIKYVGNGTTGHQIPHHMGVAPQCLIAKNLDRGGSTAGSDWHAWHTGFGTQNKYIWLNQTNPAYASSNYFTAVSSTTFSLGTDVSINADGEDIVCYAFTGIEGYSKFGAYEGNGNDDGTFVYTGFSPMLVIYKCSDATGTWAMLDTLRSPYNVTTNLLATDSSAAEASQGTFAIDIVSNGFKCRNINNDSNNSNGNSYLYLAFAESPFKTSNAR